MNTFELVKFAAPVLCALLLMFGMRVAIEFGMAEHGDARVGYALPAPKPAAESAPAAGGGAGGFSFASVAGLMPKASIENGQAIFKKCSACHGSEKGGDNKVGPNLWGVVTRKIAGKEGFQYSDALKGKSGNWTFENLASFIHGPKGFAPGTKMNFAGITDPPQLADLLAYLRTLADSPSALPPAP